MYIFMSGSGVMKQYIDICYFFDKQVDWLVFAVDLFPGGEYN